MKKMLVCVLLVLLIIPTQKLKRIMESCFDTIFPRNF